jgi:hypothetical protein
MRKGIVTLSLLAFLRAARLVNTFRLFAAPTQRKATPFDLLSAHIPARAFTRNLAAQFKQPGGDDEEFVAPAEFHIQEAGQEEDMARAMTKRNATQTGIGKKGGGNTRATSSKKGNSTSAVDGAKKKTGTTKTTSNPPATPSRTTKKGSTTASSKRAEGGSTKGTTRSSRRGKSADQLVKDVEVMAEKVGVKLPKDEKKKEREVKSAIEETSDRPYREYSKQGALEVGRQGGRGWEAEGYMKRREGRGE